MKNSFFIPLILLMILFGCQMGVKAQSVELHAVVTMTDGQEHVFVLTEEDQLSFEGQETLVVTSQGESEHLTIDDIRKIEFIDVTGADEFPNDTPLLYPNPVRQLLVIGNLHNTPLVSIYSIDGHLIRQFDAKANEPIDLSDLPSGLYILNMNDKNHKLLKL